MTIHPMPTHGLKRSPADANRDRGRLSEWKGCRLTMSVTLHAERWACVAAAVDWLSAQLQVATLAHGRHAMWPARGKFIWPAP